LGWSGGEAVAMARRRRCCFAAFMRYCLSSCHGSIDTVSFYLH
jgi:hypothetical protein